MTSPMACGNHYQPTSKMELDGLILLVVSHASIYKIHDLCPKTRPFTVCTMWHDHRPTNLSLLTYVFLYAKSGRSFFGRKCIWEKNHWIKPKKQQPFDSRQILATPKPLAWTAVLVVLQGMVLGQPGGAAIDFQPTPPINQEPLGFVSIFSILLKQKIPPGTPEKCATFGRGFSWGCVFCVNSCLLWLGRDSETACNDWLLSKKS